MARLAGSGVVSAGEVSVKVHIKSHLKPLKTDHRKVKNILALNLIISDHSFDRSCITFFTSKVTYS